MLLTRVILISTVCLGSYHLLYGGLGWDRMLRSLWRCAGIPLHALNSQSRLPRSDSSGVCYCKRFNILAPPPPHQFNILHHKKTSLPIVAKFVPIWLNLGLILVFLCLFWSILCDKLWQTLAKKANFLLENVRIP